MHDFVGVRGRSRGASTVNLLIGVLSSLAIVSGVVGFISGANARRSVAFLRSDLDARIEALAAMGGATDQALAALQQDARSTAANLAERLDAIAGAIHRLSSEPAPDVPAGGPAADPPPVAADPPEPAPGAASAPAEKYYTVEEGDTLSRIARKTGADLRALLDANRDLDPNRILVGQQITLP